jgi:hypothetical protein
MIDGVDSAMAEFRSALGDPNHGWQWAPPAPAARSKREFASDADPHAADEPAAGFIVSG